MTLEQITPSLTHSSALSTFIFISLFLSCCQFHSSVASLSASALTYESYDSLCFSSQWMRFHLLLLHFLNLIKLLAFLLVSPSSTIFFVFFLPCFFSRLIPMFCCFLSLALPLCLSRFLANPCLSFPEGSLWASPAAIHWQKKTKNKNTAKMWTLKRNCCLDFSTRGLTTEISQKYVCLVSRTSITSLYCVNEGWELAEEEELFDTVRNDKMKEFLIRLYSLYDR